jgi:hypothetical protein
MTNEYAAALAKEAECAFRATQQVVDRYNVIHAHALGMVLGLSFANPTRCPPSCTATGSAPTLPGVTAERPARVADVHELALGLPHVTVVHGARGNAVYQVGGKSFVFFRTPRPDAVDTTTGERLPDVIVFWVESEADKQALVQDETTPFFTTPHFDGHNSVLVQASRLGEITRQELAELVQDAWLAQASARRRAAWLAAHGTTPISDPDPTDGKLRTIS